MTEDEKKKAENKKKQNEYNRQIKNKQGKVDEHRKAIKELDAKIKRLREVKKKIYEQRDELNRLVTNKDRQIREDYYQWKGSWYSINFCRDQSRLVTQDVEYKSKLGDVIEKINDKINEMEVLKMNHQGIIGDLISDIKILGRLIENLAN